MRLPVPFRLPVIALLTLPVAGHAGVLGGLLGGGSGACSPQQCGSFAAPFVEPTIAGTTTSEKCLTGADGELVCKPAAGTLALLAGRPRPLLGCARRAPSACSSA